MCVTGLLRFFRSRDAARLFAAAAIAMLLNAPAQAGFFEDLFGDSAPAAAPPSPRLRSHRNGSRGEFSIRLNEPRKSRNIVRKAVQPADDHRDYVSGSRPEKPQFCAPTRSPGDPAAAYLRDETLRAGDSVVTERNIIVFKGRSACPHTAADFSNLARADLPRTKRNALAALEQAMRSPRRHFHHDAEKATASRIVGQVNE